MNSDRDFRAILGDLKNELLESAGTRFELFKAELQERGTALKSATPLLVAGAAFLGTAFLLFTGALVTLVAAGFPDGPYRWFFSSLIVGVLWSVVGAGAIFTAIRRLKMKALVPLKTIQVLSDDKSRLEDNVRKAA